MSNENKNKADTEMSNAEQKSNSIRKIILFSVLAVVVIGGSVYGWDWYQFAQSHESTDNAHIEGNISPVIPRVDGYAEHIYVDDNEKVEKGALLMSIDSTDYAVALQRQQAALKSAKAALEDAKAQLSAARAREEQSKVAMRQAENDLQRQQRLLEDHSTTQQTYDNAKFGYESAQAQHRVAQRQINVAGVKVQEAQANIEQSESALKDAELKLSYTKLRAPIAGRVSKKNVEQGQYIRPGSPVMAIANDANVWVVANFKEGQIAQIKENQLVDIEVDAYPDTVFSGKVESLGGATGSKFALLPPDNASGNFVKVEQRIPVKIVFDHPGKLHKSLKPGMNAIPTVKIN